MKLSHLETFAKVAETGSFTRAAHDLFTTQPAVTNHIQTLEQELGCQLLKRSRKKITLTENGKAIFNKVEDIFRLLDDIRNVNTPENDALTGILNIAASSVMAANHLPHILNRMLQIYPHINTQLQYGNAHSIASWVEDGFVDLGFAPMSAGFPRLIFTPLRIESCLMVTGSNSYERYREKLENGTCTDCDFVFREKGTKLHEVSMQWLKKQPFHNENQQPQILWNIESINNLVMEGTGITILPRCSVEKFLQLGLLKELPVDLTMEKITYYMIERKNERYDPATTAFREMLLEMPTP